MTICSMGEINREKSIDQGQILAERLRWTE